MYLEVVSNLIFDANGRNLPAANSMLVFFSYRTFFDYELPGVAPGSNNTVVGIELAPYIDINKKNQGFQRLIPLFIQTGPGVFKELNLSATITLTDIQYDNFNRGDVAARIKLYLEGQIPGSTVTIINP